MAGIVLTIKKAADRSAAIVYYAWRRDCRVTLAMTNLLFKRAIITFTTTTLFQPNSNLYNFYNIFNLFQPN
jgi:hypothetical protein